ncbi:MAG: glutathione transferase GstA [Caulobacteraceae bacterium]
MKLYYATGACSLAVNIVLREAGLAFDMERVDTKTHTTEHGVDFYTINPKGYVPVLRLDDGEQLTEGAAIVQYIADRHPEAGLAPACGTIERARLQEHLNYLASEVHKNFYALFHPAAAPEAKQASVAALAERFDYLESLFSVGRSYLMGDRYSATDPYLYVMLTWTHYVGVSLDKWPHLIAFRDRVAARPAVQAALHSEGLGKH